MTAPAATATERAPLSLSMLPRLNVCPASAAESADMPRIQSEPARLGTAFHAYLERWIGVGAQPDADDVALLAAMHAVPLPLLEELVYLNTVDPVASGFDAEVEVALRVETNDGEIAIPGHVDLLKPGLVVDTKTTSNPDGVHPPLQHAQLVAYGLAHLQASGRESTQIALYLPRGEPQWLVGEITPANRGGLEGWIFPLVRRALAQFTKRTEYGPNDYDWATACKGCPALSKCPVGAQWVRDGLAATPEAVTPAEIAAKWRHFEAFAPFERRRKEFRQFVTALLEQTGKPIPLSETHEIVLGGNSKSRWPVVQRRNGGG